MSDFGDVNDRPPRLSDNQPLRQAINVFKAEQAAAIAAAKPGTSLGGVVTLEDGELIGQLRLTKTSERVTVWVSPVVTYQMHQKRGPKVALAFGAEWR